MKNFYKIINNEKVWYNGYIIVGNTQVINPSDEVLIENGWIKEGELGSYIETEEDLIRQRMSEIEEELKKMDYLTSKYIDGEDMTQYGDWQGERRALRNEYRELEASLENNNN